MTGKQAQSDLLQELYNNFHIDGFHHDHQELVKKMKELPKKMMITASYDASKQK
jgi:hypothetical protein